MSLTAMAQSVIAAIDRTLERRIANRTALQLAGAPCALVCFFLTAQLAQHAGVHIAICAMKQLLGIPCPGCGITTSVAALLEGRVHDAIVANAAGPLVAAFFALQSALAVVAALRAAPDHSLLRVSHFNNRALFAALLFVWLLRMSNV